MLHQVVEIREEDRYLSLDRGFLNVQHKDRQLAAVPLDDIAILLISAQRVTLTKHILNQLSERGAITLLCGNNYHPQSVVVPVSGNYQQAGVIKTQIDASLPFRKNIWKRVVEEKLRNQAQALRSLGKEDESGVLLKISKTVKSGDPDNREAYGARMYWKALFGNEFRRDKEGGGINTYLNYGYAVIRASISRAICSAGLLPALGVHHDNRLNPFCLSDDLFEPFRPIVDLGVYALTQEEVDLELTPKVKQALIRLLWVRLRTSEGNSPLFQGLHYLAVSYVKALKAGKPELEIPLWEGTNEILPPDEQV